MQRCQGVNVLVWMGVYVQGWEGVEVRMFLCACAASWQPTDVRKQRDSMVACWLAKCKESKLASHERGQWSA